MELIKQIVATASITTIISLIITLVFNTIVNGTKKKRKQREEKLQENIRKIVREENSLGIVNDNLIKDGLQAILKNELKETYNFWIAKGYAPQDVKDDSERMYQTYHALGANGVMDAHRQKFLALPISINQVQSKAPTQKINNSNKNNNQSYRPFEY